MLWLVLLMIASLVGVAWVLHKDQQRMR